MTIVKNTAGIRPAQAAGTTPIKLAFAVTETGPDAAAGDYFTALELGSALAARYGWQVLYLPFGPDWYAVDDIDVLVVMREDYDLPRIYGMNPKLVTVAWARNWFERWGELPWLNEYSRVVASSKFAARQLSDQAGRLVHLLRLATNPERFNNSDRPARPEFDFMFTGSYWHAPRDIVPALNAIQHDFKGAIFGRNWHDVPELQALYQGFAPYDQLPALYKRTTLVIDDANHVTKHWAAANSRVFDALAAGCLVITNSASVSDELFAGQLPVYDSPAELKAPDLGIEHASEKGMRTTLLDNFLNPCEALPQTPPYPDWRAVRVHWPPDPVAVMGLHLTRSRRQLLRSRRSLQPCPPLGFKPGDRARPGCLSWRRGRL